MSIANIKKYSMEDREFYDLFVDYFEGQDIAFLRAMCLQLVEDLVVDSYKSKKCTGATFQEMQDKTKAIQAIINEI